MGVYNPNADMPVSCAECDTRGGSNCFLSNQLSYPDVLRRRHPDCPLVEVNAPHGRLKDVDKILHGEGRYVISFGRDWIDTEEINRAPIIIEAEDECDSDSCPIHFPDEQQKYDPNEFFSAERSGQW